MIRVMTPAELGAALRRRRRELNLAQEDVANVIGVNRRVIGELEGGKDTVQLKIALEAARAVGLDIHLQPRGR
jgi:HTH-type transcriptional regulator/antitoxin HipB